jgi:4-hydroxy-4-methyl-2-oxoglutarate aldolase
MNEANAGMPAECASNRLTHGELLELRRWNTPTIYNGWEQVTKHDAGREGFNLEETIDFMPQMGAMVGEK